MLGLLILTSATTTAQNAPNSQKIAKPTATAHCFCSASWDLGSNPSSINPSFIDWGAIKAYSGLFPQKEANQQDCKSYCAQQAASDSRFTADWWCANVIAESQKPYTGKMIAYSKVGTHDYRIALERDVSCSKGQTTSTPSAGFVAVDSKLKEECGRYNNFQQQVKISNPLISPRMNKVIGAKGWSIAGYNSNSPNQVFLESFNLKSCKVCYAEMTVRVRAIQDARSENMSDAGNDALNILGGPDSGLAPDYGISPILQGFRLWQSPAPAPNLPVSAGTMKNINFQIPANKLNEYIFNTGYGTPLDVLVQDDSAVLAVILRVWYY